MGEFTLSQWQKFVQRSMDDLWCGNIVLFQEEHDLLDWIFISGDACFKRLSWGNTWVWIIIVSDLEQFILLLQNMVTFSLQASDNPD